MSAQDYAGRFRSLNVNRSGGGFSPHKPSMLLAVIDLFETGKLADNAIYFEESLLTRYAEYFNVVKTETDHLNPWMPFFHLRKDGFWHHSPLQGRESILAAMDSARRKRDITDNIDYVVLDSQLFDLLQNPMDRDLLRETIILHWFPDFSKQLFELVGVTQFEKILKNGESAHTNEQFTTPVRSAAFRRLVIEAYEYRCAASGWRIILPDYTVLVQAAHIVPFSESADDCPQNGIALTPNFHWALDKNIIAPGPDLKWHVAKSLDERIADNRPLLDLEGKPLILPKEEQYHPDEASLQWRIDRLAE